MNSGEILQERYQIDTILGQGSMGMTYKALDLETRSPVAVKVLHFSRMQEWKSLELFEREASILQQLNHPRIPNYLAYFTEETDTDARFVLVQEYIEGKTLEELVLEGWRGTEQEISNLLLQAVDVLEYLHSLQPPVIHRDINPNNIILSPENKLYLVDFGAVQERIRTTFLGGATVVGTFGYMPFEQIQGRTVPASDYYALGATMLCLFTHRHPTEFPVNGMKPDFQAYLNTSPGMRHLLEGLLEPDVAKRIASPDQVRSFLLQPDNIMHVDTKTAVQKRLSMTRRHKEPEPSFGRKPLVAMLLLVLLIGAGGMGYRSGILDRFHSERSGAETGEESPRSTTENLLAMGHHAKVKGTLDIKINPPEEFDFKKKEDIYAIRATYVQEYPLLLQSEYSPSDFVFGSIVSGKPWWGILGDSYYGDGKKSIAGPSEESRFVSNPFLLVGLRDKYARRIPAGHIMPQAIYPKPHGLRWNAEKSFVTVTYNLSDYWKKFAELYPDMPFTELDAFEMVAYNARDFGLRFLYVVPNKSENIVFHNKSGNVISLRQMIHTGGSCGYPGLCNNMGPNTNEMALTVPKVPASIHIKLWRNFPKSVKSTPDMTVAVELI